LEDLRKDYDLKMQIINEIKREKEIIEQHEEQIKQIDQVRRAGEIKQVAIKFKQIKTTEQQQKEKEEAE
jgi:hypothetical protein